MSGSFAASKYRTKLNLIFTFGLQEFGADITAQSV
jgi:hypothetical protein